ncbi:MAG: RRXRR domain-containing protein [Eubacteriales bacterium]|nr:RRXRR domain-containing protein [Eubacteriales bacterium]
MEAIVYILDMSGKPLMPTKRYGKVRRMLKNKQAHVVHAKPFTIQLDYEPKTHVVQDITLGIDPGRTNIGFAAVRDDGNCIMSGTLITRNRDIPDLMKARAAHRRASRRGERLRRKRRAKKNNTTREFPNGRKLPGCDEPLALKDIINTEARFNNRMRPDGWITPTVRQLVQTHVGLVSLIKKYLPISHVCMEINRVAFMELDAGHKLYGEAFCHGPLFGFVSSKEAVHAMQDGKCLMCGAKIQHIHHIVPESKGGSDTISNKVGLCQQCHTAVHTNPIAADQLTDLVAGFKAKYTGTGVLNTATPFIIKKLTERFDNRLYLTTGYETKQFRDKHGIDRTHASDAACIACCNIDTAPSISLPEMNIRQFRRHDRSIIKAQTERTYKLNGETVAKNRKPRFEQVGLSLMEWYQDTVKKYGKDAADRMRSTLSVTPSKRRYNSIGRHLPGSVFKFNNNTFIMTGQLSRGAYLRALGEGKRNIPARDCKFIRNGGLVFI